MVAQFIYLTVGAYGPGLLLMDAKVDLSPFQAPGGAVGIDLLKPDGLTTVSLPGVIVSLGPPTVINPEGGMFTVDVPQGTFNQVGVYKVNAKLTATGVVTYGATATLKVLPEFGE